MEDSFDEANLLYVRKNYETEVTEKARRIFADNTVQTTLDETNKKLDELIAEMNEKLGFVTQKMTGNGGVEEYVRDVHTQIDNTAVDSTKLVDTGIVETGSHPSVTAFKSNRSETKYKNYDFINKTIDIGFDDKSLRFYNNTDIEPTDNIHTFKIHMDDVETLKIIEFSFTYSQCPNLVKIIGGKVYKEATTAVNRVFYGRFFIIRHDPKNAPEEIIVKAIIENADNTSNVIDEYAIDVKKSNIEDKMSLKNELGPTFDFYFRIASSSELLISIGNINPYKYLLEKSYVETNKEIIDNFNILKSGIDKFNIDKIFYSENLNRVFIVDETTKKIYSTIALDKYSMDTIAIDSSTEYNKLTADGFWVKDVGAYTFVGNNTNHCYVYTKDDVSEPVDLGVMVEDVQLMSTNEIIVQVGSILNERKISRLHMFNYSSTNINPEVFGEFHVSTTDLRFNQKNKFMEYEPGKIILVSNSRTGTIYYRFLRFNNSTNSYTNDAMSSVTIEQKIELPELKDFNPDNDGTYLDIVPSQTGLFILMNYNSVTNGKKSVLVVARDLTINTSRFVFEHVNVLKKYNYNTNLSTNLLEYIEKIIPTSMFTFGITSENKLLIIDDNNIVDAVSFSPVEEGGVVKGYTDKHSMLYMLPIDGENEYYKTDKPYFQNVKNVYQSYKGNIFILDGKGVYELTSNKNLVCKFWTNDETFTGTIVNRTIDSFLVSTTTDNKYNIFHHEFSNDESSTKKLRHKYHDLVNGNYTRFDPNKDYSDYEMGENEIIIDFSAKLYCTLVDKLSLMYNSKDINNMVYTNTEFTFNDINPSVEHNLTISVDGTAVIKNIPISKFTLSTNKYGFINYHGFTLLNTSNLSDINNENLYVLVHKTGDNLTIADYREVIYRLIKELTIKENDKYDESGNIKPGYETTITVRKNYKNVNKNIVIRDAIDEDDVEGFRPYMFRGVAVFNNTAVIDDDKLKLLRISNVRDLDESTVRLPIRFESGARGHDAARLRHIDPFSIAIDGENHIVGFDSHDDTALNVVAEHASDGGNPVIKFTKTGIIRAHDINGEVYYSKITGGLFKMDSTYNEVIIVSPDLGYIFYDFEKINDGIYGVTNKSVLVKINESDPRSIPSVVIHEPDIISDKGNLIGLNTVIYKFESSPDIFVIRFHIGNEYTPTILAVSSDEPSKYTKIQSYNNIEKCNDYVFDFVEIHDTVFTNGSKIYTFDPKTLEFTNINCNGYSRLTAALDNSPLYSKDVYGEAVNLENDLRVYKTVYGTGVMYPQYGSHESGLSLIIDKCSKDFAFNLTGQLRSFTNNNNGFSYSDPQHSENKTLISYLSNKESAGKKYKISISNDGIVKVAGVVPHSNGEQLSREYNVQDYKATKYTKGLSIATDSNNRVYFKDPVTNERIKLFKLDHSRCKWIALSFDQPTLVRDLFEMYGDAIQLYKYIEDSTDNYVEVDTTITKYPLKGVKYYTKTVIGSVDSYEQLSKNITSWNLTNNTKYYERKHHYELVSPTDIFNTGEYVFICENKYFSELNALEYFNGKQLSDSDEYYTLEAVTKTVKINNAERRIDERHVSVLNDDKLLITAPCKGEDNDVDKTIIYDTYVENDFTRHDVWNKVYPKAGVVIYRIWETLKGKFALYKLPYHDGWFMGRISDDLQEIYSSIENVKINEPLGVHLIYTSKEIIVSITNSDMTSCTCYSYDSITNIFKQITDSNIYIDTVVVENKTYIAAISVNLSNGTGIPVYTLNIFDEDKHIVFTTGSTGMFVPTYSSNRSEYKQFNNLFVKRINSKTGKEEVYIFGKYYKNYNAEESTTYGDTKTDCIKIDGDGIKRLDFNFASYDHIRNPDYHGSNVILAPDNKILILDLFGSILSIDEDEKVEFINFTHYNDGDEYIFPSSIYVYRGYDGQIPFDQMDSLSNVLLLTDNLVKTYCVNEHVDRIEQYQDIDGSLYDYHLKYKYYLTNINFDIGIGTGNPWDVYDTLTKYSYDPGTNEFTKIDDYKTKYPSTLFNQKILPVKYKDTMIFGTSVLDEKTGMPSTDWFSIYDTDKVTLISNYICFEYLFVTKSGKMFGVYKNAIYENDDVLSSSKWFRVNGGSVYENSKFKKMLETGYGIFYIDGRNVLNYNADLDKFEVVRTAMDTENEFNFAESFDTGLFIGCRRSVLSGINFNYYDPNKKEFVLLIPDNVRTEIAGMNESVIVDIKDTSRGVFVLYYNSDSRNTIFRCYMSVNGLMMWEECKYRTEYKFLNSTHFDKQYPCNLSTIYEDIGTNTIWLTGSVVDLTYLPDNEVGSKYESWAYRQYIENDNSDYRHNHGSNFRFEPNVPNISNNINDLDKHEELDIISGEKHLYLDTIYNIRSEHSFNFEYLKGFVDLIETEHFGTFAIPNDINIVSNFYKMIYEVNGYGLNNGVRDISYFVYKNISDALLPLKYNISPSNPIIGYTIKEFDNVLYLLMYSIDTILIMKKTYDEETKTYSNWEFVFNKPNVVNGSSYDDYIGIGYNYVINDRIYVNKIEKCDIQVYNGIIYLKYNDSSFIQIIGSSEFDGVESNPEVESNNVLYELRAVFDNQDSYNNLVEKTDNSNLDKFVFKEIGIIDGITGETKHIFQFFEPNEFYNGSDGLVKSLIDNPKEFMISNTIKQLYKNAYQKFNKKNLINNRFIKPGQTYIADGFKHETNQILGDVENYLINTDNVRIELKIYPTETEDFIDSLNKPCEFGIVTAVNDDESGIEPFDPYD